MCHVMGLDPSPHNGTWDIVKDMLQSPDSKTKSNLNSLENDVKNMSDEIDFRGTIMVVTICTCIAGLIGVSVGIIIHNRCRFSGRRYKRLPLTKGLLAESMEDDELDL